MLFYARDIDEGLGERRVFRVGLRYLANYHPEVVRANIANIVKFGRYDDLYALDGTSVMNDAYALIKAQLIADLEAFRDRKPVSLLAKWLKSTNASSEETKRLGKQTAKALGLSIKEYRLILSELRRYLDVVEVKMSGNDWDHIDFNTVCGGAMKKYLTAFHRHQEDRFVEYLNAIKENKTIKVVKEDGTVVEKQAKINTKKLFPYEIVQKYIKESNSLYWDVRINKPINEYEVMWNSLKDWVGGVEANMLVMTDTSGSMTSNNCLPLSTSVGLAIYFAEKNKGIFHNKFIRFSNRAHWTSLSDNATLAEKINKVVEDDYWGSTNVESAFKLILDTAVNNHLAPEDMPKALVIVSDMEFNQATEGQTTFYKGMKDKFNAFGYEIPEIVFWNVNARNDTYHTTKNTPYVRMVSGQATSIFKSLIDGKKHTPYDFMLEVLSNERYNVIKA